MYALRDFEDNRKYIPSLYLKSDYVKNSQKDTEDAIADFQKATEKNNNTPTPKTSKIKN